MGKAAVNTFRIFLPIATGVLLLFVRVANGCPLCHSRTGEQVRAAIFNQSFASNLLVTVLPFSVFAGLVAILYFAPPKERRAGEEETRNNQSDSE